MIKHIAIFASGKGSNAKKIIEYFNSQPEKNIKVSLIVSNNKNAGVIDVANENNVPFVVIDKTSFFAPTFQLSIFSTSKIDYLILAGFLWKIPSHLIAQFPNKIINIHPALLPKFGGKGMYGDYVHSAVIAANEKETGITIHYVNENYDEGKIIFQKKFPIEKTDTVETVTQKIHQLEHQYFSMVIENVINENFEK